MCAGSRSSGSEPDLPDLHRVGLGEEPAADLVVAPGAGELASQLRRPVRRNRSQSHRRQAAAVASGEVDRGRVLGNRHRSHPSGLNEVWRTFAQTLWQADINV